MKVKSLGGGGHLCVSWKWQAEEMWRRRIFLPPLLLFLHHIHPGRGFQRQRGRDPFPPESPSFPARERRS